MTEEMYKDEEWLRREVEEKNRSFYEIGNQFGKDESAVRCFATRYGIEKPLESERLLQEALDEGLDVEDMMEKWNCEKWELVIAFEKQGLT